MTAEISYQIWVVGAIVLGTGIFGGLTAYLADQATLTMTREFSNRSSLPRYIALGISATICVPLILSLVQSTLIPKIFDPERLDGKNTIPYAEFLIFTGICIVSAITARKFLDTLSDRVLRDVSRLERRTDSIGQQAATAQAKAIEAEAKAEISSVLSREMSDEQAVEPRSEPPDQEFGLGLDIPRVDLSSLEQNALVRLIQVTFRTTTGISQNLGISHAQTSDLLDTLAAKRLVERTTSPTTGGPRWRITPQGAAAIR